MAAAIGTASGVVALVGATFTIVQETRKAKHRVQGSSKTLDDISKQLDTLEGSLNLVQSEESLQTAAVTAQISSVADVATELKSSFDRMTAIQDRNTSSRLLHAFKSGDRDDEELKGILDRLDSARQELYLRISVAHVGLFGDFHSGFRVAYGVLIETNKRVQEVLGINLVLVDLIKSRSPQLVNGMITLHETDLEVLGMAGGTAANKTGTTSIYGNVTTGDAYFMTGNVGVERWHRASGRKTTIANNTFGKDVRYMTGDMGGEAAAKFNENFWN